MSNLDVDSGLTKFKEYNMYCMIHKQNTLRYCFALKELFVEPNAIGSMSGLVFDKVALCHLHMWPLRLLFRIE